jgi:hypothetical protein
VDAQSPPGSEAECEVRFDGLSARSVKPGDRITATLTVVPREAVKATEVRVEARAHKTSHSSRGTEVDRLQDVKQVVCGNIELAAGQPQSWPVSLAVPTDAVPSLQTALTTVRWQLVGIVARRMRSDHRSDGHPQQIADNRIGAQWTPAVVFGYLVLIMVFRPQGLIGEETREAG